MNEKIGMYTEDEILEHLTEGEGRGFLGRSMYDAIFDKIHALKTKNEQLQQENARLKDKIEKLFKIVDDKLTNLNLEYGVDNEFREEYDEILEILKEN